MIFTEFDIGKHRFQVKNAYCDVKTCEKRVKNARKHTKSFEKWWEISGNFTAETAEHAEKMFGHPSSLCFAGAGDKTQKV